MGPLVATEMDLCIQCTRCVRFSEEVAGCRDLGTLNKGSKMYIGTYLKDSGLKSELSGNVIDLCPVGALTSKPFAFKGRSWEFDQHSSIASHDCLGANIHVHTINNGPGFGQEVMRVLPKSSPMVNENWLDDRSRFSYTGLHSEDKITKPMIKINGKWRESRWSSVFSFIKDKLQYVSENFSTDKIVALAHPSSTSEEFFLMQRFFRSLGVGQIDHRIHSTDDSDQEYGSTLGTVSNLSSIKEILDHDLIVLVGADVQQDQPLLGASLVSASNNGSTIISLECKKLPWRSPVESVTMKPSLWTHFLASVTSLISTDTVLPKEVIDAVNGEDVLAQTWAKYWNEAKKPLIIWGNQLETLNDSANIRNLLKSWLHTKESGFLPLSYGANQAGAWLTGAVPHRLPEGKPNNDYYGEHCAKWWSEDNIVYWLHGIEPENDIINNQHADESLSRAEMIVCVNSYASKVLEYADVILPLADFSENEGSYINVNGLMQSFKPVRQSKSMARPGWKIYQALSSTLI